VFAALAAISIFSVFSVFSVLTLGPILFLFVFVFVSVFVFVFVFVPRVGMRVYQHSRSSALLDDYPSGAQATVRIQSAFDAHEGIGPQ
jgi:hypothetical protein